ncbi:hypothetical protein [Streptomyces sp. NPDC002851]
MSLVELIAQADERGLAASGLACLDRCLPLLGADDDALLRPLWTSLERGAAWDGCLDKARAELPEDSGGDTGEEAVLVRRMFDAVPVERSATDLRAWSDACSVAALQVHRLVEAAAASAASADSAAVSEQLRRGGEREAPAGPLVAGELRRQVRILELLSGGGGAGGLRQAFDLSTEGRRILRAAVSRSRRARQA